MAKGFPNLARKITTAGMVVDGKCRESLSSDAQSIVEYVTITITQELVDAGVPSTVDHENRPNCGVWDRNFNNDLERLRLSNGYFPEVPTSIVGFYNGWTFERRWYYYTAEGDGIPPEFANPFDDEWGTQVRAHGDGACRGAAFWSRGFGCGSYHIDTPEGLKAFVQLLDKVYKPAPEKKRS